MRSVFVAAIVGFSIVASACSHAWDDYDPRLGAGGSDVAATSSGPGEPTSNASTSGGGAVVSSGSGASPSSSQGTGGDGGSGDGGAGPSVSSSSGSSGGSSSESSSTGTPTETIEIVAVEADCTEPDNPDPDFCDFASPADAFTIDIAETPDTYTFQGYLRFLVGDELTGKTIESVTLRLVAATADLAESDNSGEVWRSDSFDRDTLRFEAPALLEGAPLAGSVGAVAQGEEVMFVLEGLAIVPESTVYLGIKPISTDGVDYLDERSATPPTLVVTYQ